MGWSALRDPKTRAEWRERLLVEQNGLCALCGHRFARAGEVNEAIAAEFGATFDHIVPRSQGGGDELGNLRLVHRGCNRARGDGTGSKAPPATPRVLRASPAPK